MASGPFWWGNLRSSISPCGPTGREVCTRRARACARGLKVCTHWSGSGQARYGHIGGRFFDARLHVDGRPLVDAQPLGGQKKKGADSGIDGKVTFSDVGGTVREVLVSVKGGHVNVSQVRDLKGTMEREGAPLGLFLTLEEPSEPMRVEAATAGVFHSELADRDYPKVQILTIKGLLDGKRPVLPMLVMPAYQPAERVQVAPGQEEMFG